jgi:hypothetical protein
MLDQLPEDQRLLIEERLSPHGALELEKDVRAEVVTFPRKGSHVERESVPLTVYYWRCLREMGPMSKSAKVRIPKPMYAWLEVYNQKTVPEPTFSHPKIAETVTYLGGWSRMWLDFSKKKEEKARNTFIMQYKDAIGD